MSYHIVPQDHTLLAPGERNEYLQLLRACAGDSLQRLLALSPLTARLDFQCARDVLAMLARRPTNKAAQSRATAQDKLDRIDAEIQRLKADRAKAEQEMVQAQTIQTLERWRHDLAAVAYRPAVREALAKELQAAGAL